MAKNSNQSRKMPAHEKLKWERNLIQLVFFLTLPALFAQAFGGMKEIAGEMGNGSVLGFSAFTVRLIALCVLTVLAGRVFCGWACAFGAAGDWVYQLAAFVQKKTRKKLPRIPEKLLHMLQKLKYIVLAAILALCFFQRSALVTKYSPWTVFSLITAGNFRFGDYGAAIVLLLLIVAGTALQERFFCQCICPLGAVFSLLPQLPLTAWKRDSKRCISGCQACRQHCPVKIKLNENPFQESECIRCGRCSTVCHRKNIQPGIRNILGDVLDREKTKCYHTNCN